MFELSIIIGLVVLLAVSDWNPVRAIRKVWAAVRFGWGATPTTLKTGKSKVELWTEQAKTAEAQEGKKFERVGEHFQKKGEEWAEKELTPQIEKDALEIERLRKLRAALAQ